MDFIFYHPTPKINGTFKKVICSIPMASNLTLLLLLLTFSTTAISQDVIPKVVHGRIERIENFSSKYVAPRHVDVWLPEGYSDTTAYAVLYMHDGQMLYDPAQTWNKQAWDVDDVASDLLRQHQLHNFIVVGIWNGGPARHREYFPEKPFAYLSTSEKNTVNAQLQAGGRTKDRFRPVSDNYLKFLVKELKPYIDKTYSVHTNPENTFIAGSSMGGLISLYALCEYPRVFGGAACISTHWVGTFTTENNPIPDAFLRYLNKNLPNPENCKIYFDCGDQALDALYPEIQKRVDGLMQEKGFTARNWLTRYFPGEDHSEQAWKKRLHIPLGFLLGK